MLWDEEMIRRLNELLDRGLSRSAIGRTLGVTKDSVAAKIRRMWLDDKEIDVEQMDKFAEALENGASIKQAGIAVGVKDTRAREIFRKICKDLGAQAQ